MGYYSRISKAFLNAPVLPLNEDSKYVLISDCHRGKGNNNDNFLKNQNLYFAALNHYYEEGFTYLEVGDGDELWENRKMQEITEIHSNVFWLLNKFHLENRLYMLYGNHDIVKKRRRFFSRYCPADAYAQRPQFLHLLSTLEFYSGLILDDQLSGRQVYLTHGHQADFLNSAIWPVARFLVRYVWTIMERFAFKDPTSAAKNNTKKEKTEKRLTKWAVDEGHILIAGHTHRPMLGTINSPYFNTGSCVHPRCITGIEIEGRCFTLIKWLVDTKEDRTLFVSREVLAGPICMDDYC